MGEPHRKQSASPNRGKSRYRSAEIDAGLAMTKSTKAPSLRFRAFFVGLLCVVASWVLGVPGDAWAGAFDVADTSWEGGSAFLEIARQELGEARVKPVAVIDWSAVGPEDGVLVLHPLVDMDPDDSTAFMKAGGRLAVLDDYGRGDTILERFRIERTSAPTRPVSALRNRPALAIAEPVVDMVAGHATGPHPVAARVTRLVTNHATALRHPNLSPVLRIRAIGEPDAIIAVAGQVGRGRLFAMSDPSAITNQMLRYPGNRAFAAALARYLVDDDGTQRRGGRLFVIVKKFKEEGSFGGEKTIGKALEQQLRSIASALSDARREGLPTWLYVVFAAAAALAVATWVGSFSARIYGSPLPRYARRIPVVAQGGAAGRSAVLGASSSPQGLVLLELKSALVEALVFRFALPGEPGAEAIDGLLSSHGVPDELRAHLRDVLRSIQRVETAVVRGHPPSVPTSHLEHASAVVRDVLLACGILPPPPPTPKPEQGASSS